MTVLDYDRVAFSTWSEFQDRLDVDNTELVAATPLSADTITDQLESNHPRADWTCNPLKDTPSQALHAIFEQESLTLRDTAQTVLELRPDPYLLTNAPHAPHVFVVFVLTSAPHSQ